MNTLRFGYNAGLPEGIQSAWGCRAILDAGYADIPHDRVDSFGDSAAIVDYLNKNFNKGMMNDKVKQLVPPDRPGMDAPEIVLFDDDKLVVKCSTQRSFGYLYICAYFKENN
jgi:hypothetical protein